MMPARVTYFVPLALTGGVTPPYWRFAFDACSPLCNKASPTNFSLVSVYKSRPYQRTLTPRSNAARGSPLCPCLVQGKKANVPKITVADLPTSTEMVSRRSFDGWMHG
jgi:hypothetical protein